MSKFSDPQNIETFNKHYNSISAESDRGAVILSVSILDSILEDTLKKFFLDSPTKNDELFDGAYSPLSSFSAKIETCHRLGLIRENIKKQLKLLKKIRNDFAHRLDTATLNDEANKNRLFEILKCTPDITEKLNGSIVTAGISIDTNAEKNLLNGTGCRDTFNYLFSMICAALNMAAEDTTKIDCFIIED